jgi:hypothetical protein
MVYKFDLDFITHGFSRVTFVGPEVVAKMAGLGIGYPYHGPTHNLAQQTNKGKMYDMFPLPALCGVSERFRRIVEELEPGVHQFFPLTILQRSGTPFDEKYYILNVCQDFEAQLYPDLSKRVFLDERFNPPQVNYEPRIRYYDGEQVFSRSTIAGRHLWRSLIHRYFISDTLLTRLKQENIKHFELTPSKGPGYSEVDQKWIARDQVPELVTWFEDGLIDLKNGVENFRIRQLASAFDRYLSYLSNNLLELVPEYLKHEAYLRQYKKQKMATQ